MEDTIQGFQHNNKNNSWVGLEKFSFCKRILQIVVSVFTFSLILSYSYGDFSFFPHSFHIYFSTFLFSLLTRILERKYMFLLCNGILAVLAKTSLVSKSFSNPEMRALSVDDELVALENTWSSVDFAFAAAKVEEEKKELEEETEDDEEELKGIRCADEQREHRPEEERYESLMEEGEGENETSERESEEVGSTEELNKKFEEFIRKMKEEIRIEAQQQLIAV